MPQIEINVRFFGPAREWAGLENTTMAVVECTTLGAVAGILSEKYPRLGQAVGVRLALNQAFVPLSTTVKVGDEVAIRQQNIDNGPFLNLSITIKKYSPPEWLELDKSKYAGKVIVRPPAEDLSKSYNLSSIVEYYSR